MGMIRKDYKKTKHNKQELNTQDKKTKIVKSKICDRRQL